MSEAPVNVSMKDTDKLIGRFVVLYRNEVKTPAKIENIVTVNEKEKRLVYELMGGPDKGKRFSSKFDESQTAWVYDEDNKVLALLEN